MAKQKIIFADDDEALRGVISTLLEQHGYQVILAKDGAEAVELTREKLPAAVIIDLMMPVKNGIDACKEIKANNATKQIPVIIFTGAAGLDEISQAMASGANACLTKPCDTKILLDTLANAITPGKKVRWATAKRHDTPSAT